MKLRAAHGAWPSWPGSERGGTPVPPVGITTIKPICLSTVFSLVGRVPHLPPRSTVCAGWPSLCALGKCLTRNVGIDILTVGMEGKKNGKFQRHQYQGAGYGSEENSHSFGLE